MTLVKIAFELSILLGLSLLLGVGQKDRSTVGRIPFLWLALVCMLCAAAVVAPVSVRNFLVSGEPVLISNNGGVTFYHGNNHRAIGLYTAPGMSGAIRESRSTRRSRRCWG